jgi:hypothetical protein
MVAGRDRDGFSRRASWFQPATLMVAVDHHHDLGLRSSWSQPVTIMIAADDHHGFKPQPSQ